MGRTGVVLAVLAAWGTAGAASAGEATGGADDTAWSGLSLRVGGVAVVRPTYEGSDEYEVIPLPFLLPQLSPDGAGGVFTRYVDPRGADDIRIKAIQMDPIVAGPLVGYNFGRDEDDGDRLEGLGDVDDGVVAGGFVGYRWETLLFDVSYHHIVSGQDDGYQIRFGTELEQPVGDGLILTGRIGAAYADGNYMQSYFGVSDAQAAASAAGLPAFDAEAGFKDVHAELGVKADLTERWMLRANLRYSHLLGDAADSPVIETEHQLSGLIGLSYRFDLGR